jgi:hypothetical protein
MITMPRVKKMFLNGAYLTTEEHATCMDNPMFNVVHDRSQLSPQIITAVKTGNVQMIERLLDSGENIFATVDLMATRHSLLQYAVFWNQHAVVRMLLNRNALDVSDRGGGSDKTPLHIATSQADAVMAELLLEHGADIEAKDRNGMTPLHTAVLGNYPRIVRILLNNGASIQARTYWKEHDNSIMCRAATPMDIARDMHRSAHASQIIMMLEKEQEARDCAVMMGQHERLGMASRLSWLEPEHVRMILEFARM